MTARHPQLGGRLPLLGPRSLKGAALDLYGQLVATIVPAADAQGYATSDDHGHLIGPFNAALYSPEMTGAFLHLQTQEKRYTSLSERTRQVIILSVGSLWASPYELYAHKAEAKTAGLHQRQIDQLAVGLPADHLLAGEASAQLFTLELVKERGVSAGTYATAQQLFDDRGLVEMVMLIGCYLTVCSLLNTFAVPIPTGQPHNRK